MVAQIDRHYVSTRPMRLWPRLLAYLLFEGRPVTTRGQWFNSIVFLIAGFLKRLPDPMKVKAPAFILGTGRSGTTILGVVLSMHRDIGFLNEPKALWAGLYPNEDLIGSYNRNGARYRLDAGDASPDVVRNAHRMYSWYLRLAGARQVVDKYPELIFRTDFLREIFPDARFMFLSRNGIATCSSVRFWSKRLGQEVDGETHDWWGVNDRKWFYLTEQLVPEYPDLVSYADQLQYLSDEGRAAVEWIIAMREGLRLVNADPVGTLHVPYEALCAAPREWAMRIEAFLNLPQDAVFENFTAATLSEPDRSIQLNLPDWLADILAETNDYLKAAYAVKQSPFCTGPIS